MCLRNFILSGKQEEIFQKRKDFLEKNIGFIVNQIRRKDYDYILNRDSMFWKDLGFKEININSTKTSKKANSLIKRTRKRNGKIYYSCHTKKKLAFLIPTKGMIPVLGHYGKKFPQMVECYTIIIL